MSEVESTRINQMFIRGIALVTVGLLCTVLFLTFSTINQDAFYSFENQLSSDENSPIKNIGLIFGTFRVYDLLILLSILLITIIGSYYLVNFKITKSAPRRDQRRYH